MKNVFWERKDGIDVDLRLFDSDALAWNILVSYYFGKLKVFGQHVGVRHRTDIKAYHFIVCGTYVPKTMQKLHLAI